MLSRRIRIWYTVPLAKWVAFMIPKPQKCSPGAVSKWRRTLTSGAVSRTALAPGAADGLPALAEGAFPALALEVFATAPVTSVGPVLTIYIYISPSGPQATPGLMGRRSVCASATPLNVA